MPVAGGAVSQRRESATLRADLVPPCEAPAGAVTAAGSLGVGQAGKSRVPGARLSLQRLTSPGDRLRAHRVLHRRIPVLSTITAWKCEAQSGQVTRRRPRSCVIVLGFKSTGHLPI